MGGRQAAIWPKRWDDQIRLILRPLYDAMETRFTNIAIALREMDMLDPDLLDEFPKAEFPDLRDLYQVWLFFFKKKKNLMRGVQVAKPLIQQPQDWAVLSKAAKALKAEIDEATTALEDSKLRRDSPEFATEMKLLLFKYEYVDQFQDLLADMEPAK